MLQSDAFCEHTTQQNATASGAYSAPPDPLAGFKRAASRRGARGGSEGGKREGVQGQGGNGGEGRLTLMRSWNRAADWLRPAMLITTTTTTTTTVLCCYSENPAASVQSANAAVKTVRAGRALQTRPLERSDDLQLTSNWHPDMLRAISGRGVESFRQNADFSSYSGPAMPGVLRSAYAVITIAIRLRRIARGCFHLTRAKNEHVKFSSSVA